MERYNNSLMYIMCQCDILLLIIRITFESYTSFISEQIQDVYIYICRLSQTFSTHNLNSVFKSIKWIYYLQQKVGWIGCSHIVLVLCFSNSKLLLTWDRINLINIHRLEIQNITYLKKRSLLCVLFHILYHIYM